MVSCLGLIALNVVPEKNIHLKVSTIKILGKVLQSSKLRRFLIIFKNLFQTQPKVVIFKNAINFVFGKQSIVLLKKIRIAFSVINIIKQNFEEVHIFWVKYIKVTYPGARDALYFYTVSP